LFERFKDPGFEYGVTLAETAGHTVLRMANADGLPFDFSHLLKTVDDYTKELISLSDATRETTEFENMLIISGSYKVGEDPTKGYILPKVKPDVPFLDFSPLQNAVQKLRSGVDSLTAVYQKNINAGNVDEAFNRSLYLAERQLLNEAGLPRRSWYKHTLYAPGYYTGYGVKTMPGIREAIEQRNWKEAQEQIEVTAKTIEGLAKYFILTSTSAK
jgi:N-acetylated-alpha-linked acidic dipeptidase